MTTKLSPEERLRIYEEEKARIEVPSNDKPQARSGPIRDTYIVIAIVVAIIGTAWGLWYISGDQIDQKLTPPVSTPVPDTGMVAPATANPEPSVSPLAGLVVKQWSFVRTSGEPGELTYQVSGELTNNTSQSYSVVYLAVALYDKAHNIVATSYVAAGNVPAGGKGMISGYVIDKTSTPHPTGEISVSSAQ